MVGVCTHKVQLSYILALLTPYIEIKSHPPKILFSYPDIVEIQKKLCFDIKNANDVLSDFSKEELNKLEDIIKHTINAIEALKSADIDEVKSKFTLK